MKIILNIVRIAGPILMVASLSGCLMATTHHFNTGVPLEPGHWEYTYGLSIPEVAICQNPDGLDLDEEGGYTICRNADSVVAGPWRKDVYQRRMEMPSLSRGYRLGVRKQWGPITGVDLGYHMEYPNNLEFDGRFGLPVPTAATWHHSISAGWGIGFWADNTWFLEYAASKTFSPVTLYANFRESLLGTRIVDLQMEKQSSENKNDIFKHQRRFLHQMNAGVRLDNPNKWFFPDVYHLNYHIGYPVLMLGGETTTSSRNIGLVDNSILFGMGWHFHD